jgi:sulfur carrier protein
MSRNQLSPAKRYFYPCHAPALPTMITVSINGSTRQLREFTYIAALIEEMGLTGKRIALERNGEIVPRSSYATQALAEGDKLEVVVAVGGG